MISTKSQFKKAARYLSESKNFIYSAALLFLLSAIAGFIFRPHLTFFNELIREIFQKTSGLNTLEITFFILQNNLSIAFFAIFLGILFGVPPAIATILNGAVIGYVIGAVHDASETASLWQLLPHGIFELPAIFISVGLGIKLGASIFLPEKIRAKEFKSRFYNSANTFLMIVAPLLIIAAFIEGLLIFFVN